MLMLNEDVNKAEIHLKPTRMPFKSGETQMSLISGKMCILIILMSAKNLLLKLSLNSHIT